MFNIVYGLLIRGYYLGILAASLFNRKARLWIMGQRQSRAILKSGERIDKPVAWFHCASLGEFEQGRPVIEAYRKKKPDTFILLTFFSPSGYEIRKDYQYADRVLYLPVDFKCNTLKFLEYFHPGFAVFIKYEFWYHYLEQLHNRNIPTYLISANFRDSHWFFKWYGTSFRKVLGYFTHLFVQNKQSASLLSAHGFQNVMVAGDTRFDRVVHLAENRKSIPVAESFSSDKTVVVAGSTWKEDEELLVRYINESDSGTKWILAPHEIHEGRLRYITSNLKVPFIRFSEADENMDENIKVLLIDNIGLLSSLYGYGHLAYIGGGFGKGIHNILEPATYGIPVIFGPCFKKFQEANDLIENKGAYTISSYEELMNTLTSLISNPQTIKKSGNIAKSYVNDHLGATKSIVDILLIL